MLFYAYQFGIGNGNNRERKMSPWRSGSQVFLHISFVASNLPGAWINGTIWMSTSTWNFQSAGRVLFRRGGGCLQRTSTVKWHVWKHSITPQTWNCSGHCTDESHDAKHVHTGNHENLENREIQWWPFWEAAPCEYTANSNTSSQNYASQGFHEIVWWQISPSPNGQDLLKEISLRAANAVLERAEGHYKMGLFTVRSSRISPYSPESLF